MSVQTGRKGAKLRKVTYKDAESSNEIKDPVCDHRLQSIDFSNFVDARESIRDRFLSVQLLFKPLISLPLMTWAHPGP
jgi:hypothetical protein